MLIHGSGVVSDICDLFNEFSHDSKKMKKVASRIKFVLDHTKDQRRIHQFVNLYEDIVSEPGETGIGLIIRYPEIATFSFKRTYEYRKSALTNQLTKKSRNG